MKNARIILAIKEGRDIGKAGSFASGVDRATHVNPYAQLNLLRLPIEYRLKLKQMIDVLLYALVKVWIGGGNYRGISSHFSGILIYLLRY
jgi:hypothetical protein